MKNIVNHIFTVVIITSVTTASCSDWLGEPQPAKPGLDDYFIAGGGATAIQATNAAYVPLQWEFGQVYCSEWWIGDVASDDALKGGQNMSDVPDAYDIDNFKISPNNAILLDWYQLNFHGIARANFVLEQIPPLDVDAVMNASVKNRLLGEAYFLRALYYFRLVRVFGEVPLITKVIAGSAEWKQPKATVGAIYEQIFKDLEVANQYLWTRDELSDNDIGRATKGAAQAMLLKTHLYYARFDNSHYATAKHWGDSIIGSKKYELEPKYADNFSIDNENGRESVFEVQYGYEATSDYGDFGPLPHFGATRGTFTTILTRSRSGKFPTSESGIAEGWGFNKPTQDLYNEFEAGDSRREASILRVDTSQMSTPSEEIYLGDTLLSRKYALMDENLNALWNGHAVRSPINIKLIRYADVLLMYTEAANENGDFNAAKETLNQLRAVRRAETADPDTQLPDFPNYVNRKTGAANFTYDQAGLREAIRHERRVELAMESHRWFDLVRWGIAAKTMNDYRENETSEVQKEMASFEEGRNEYFPLPQYEIDLSGFGQDDKWK